MKKVSILTTILIVSLSACTKVNPSKQSLQSTAPQPTTSLPSPIAAAYSDWKIFSNLEYGIEFKYPKDYSKPVITGKSLLSLMSPLSPNRPAKGQNVQSDELKVEIYFGATSQGDSLEKFVAEQNKDASEQNYEVSNEKELTINDKKTHYRRVRGYGVTDNYFVLTKKYRIIIAKYPAETTRQAEFEQILNSFKFTD